MGMHDFTIEVLERSDTRVRIQIHLWEPRAINVSAIQIEAMLFEQTWIPHRERLRAWWSTKTAENEWLEIADEIQRVELLSGGPESPWTDEHWSIMDMGAVDAEAILGPPIVIEVTVDEPEMLAHLDPGERWEHSDGGFSDDEKYTFIGGPEVPPVWKRGPKPERKAPPGAEPSDWVQPPYGRLRVVEESDEALLLELCTVAELPTPVPQPWTQLLSSKYPMLRGAHSYTHPSPISGVILERVERLNEDRVKELFPDMRGVSKARRSTPLSAHYRVMVADPHWLTLGNEAFPKFDWHFVFLEMLTPCPAPSDAGALDSYKALVEEAAAEGPELLVEFLAEGFQLGLEATQWTLARAAGLGAQAGPLLDAIAATVASEDPGLARAAIACAAELGLSELEPALRVAVTRMDPQVSEAAQQALAHSFDGQ